jgi:hypothetical protein
MANPITWRNVNRTTDNAAVNLLGAAQQSMNTGLTGLGDIIKQRQQVMAQNQQAGNENLKQQFLDGLGSYKDLASFEAAQPQIDQQLQALPSSVRSQVRGQVSAMPQDLMQSENTRTAFDQNKLKAQADPLVEQLRAGIYANEVNDLNGLTPEQRDLLSQTGNLATLQDILNKTNQGEEDQKFSNTNRERTIADRGREDTRREAEQAIGVRSSELQQSLFGHIANRNTALEQIANDFQVPFDHKTGKMDLASMDPVARDQLQETITAAGLNKEPSQTQIKQEFGNIIRSEFANSGIPVAEQQAMIDRFDQTLSTMLNPATGDMAKIDSSIAASEAALRKEGNAYLLEEGLNKRTTALDVLAEVSASNPDLKDEMSWASMRPDIVDFVTEAMSKGVVLEGTDTAIPVPAAILKQVLAGFSQKWLSGEDIGTFKTRLVDAVNKTDLKEEYKKYADLDQLRNSRASRYEQAAGLVNPKASGLLAALYELNDKP